MSSATGRPGGILSILITLATVGAIVAAGAIMLPKDPYPAARARPARPGPPDLAVVTGYIPTFGQALTASGLAEVLKGPGPFTVFAPEESAFASLPEGTLNSLLKPENKAALRTLISRHVARGRFTLEDLRGMDRLQTLDGAILEVRNAPEGITVDGALITTPDEKAANGVLHIVGAVLMPGVGP